MSLCLLTLTGFARAQDASEQEALFQRMLKQPTNHQITFEFARVATARGDYEAAIGALERLLFYNSNLPLVKYELGSLYFRLRAYDMAARYFREALASADLDAATRRRAESYLPDAEKQSQQSRFSGFVQTGARWQSNASFAPSTGAIRFGGQDLALLPSAQKKSDWNWFGLAGLAHDYDLGNQRGDVLETRFAGYLTQQHRLSELNVGLFDMSFGPRLALELIPGATIKPYVVGGNTWVGGSSYQSSVGAGVALRLPFNDRFTIEPGFEWRRSDFNTTDAIPVSTFNSGDWYTGLISASYQLAQPLRLDARGLYRRGESAFSFQSFDQWAVEAALTFEFAPPSDFIVRNWSISPFAKFIETDFDAANPFLDPLTIRRDSQWTVGALFNAPITKALGFTAAVQYDQTNSTLPNYRLDNFSVTLGPTVRF